MTIFSDSLSSSSVPGKRARPAVCPLSHLSDESQDHKYLVVIAHLGPTSDRLPVKITCTVTSICMVLSKCLKSAVWQGFFFLILRKMLLTNFSFFFQFFSLNFSLIWNRLGVSAESILSCWQTYHFLGRFLCQYVMKSSKLESDQFKAFQYPSAVRLVLGA